jgi:creatinine amidohydrolase
MSARELFSATWESVRDLERERVVAILPIGAIEAHGPHLPLGTDVVIAEAMAKAGAERLAARGQNALLLPPLAYTAAPFGAAFPGTISLAPATVTAVVTDIGRSLAAHGIPLLAFANAHLDPAHLASLHEAAAALRGNGAIGVAFPDLTRRRWASRLTAEFQSGACHAGCYETSIVLAERADLVGDEVRRTLPPIPRSLVAAIRAGKRTFEEAGGARAYFGDPAAASAKEGERTIAVLAGILADAVLEALEALEARETARRVAAGGDASSIPEGGER